MNELQIVTTNDKTPIEVLLQVDKDDRVSARDTYEFLQLTDGQFARWSKTNILENQFAIENEDYTVTDIDVDVRNNFAGQVVRTMADYRLSVPFAKKLCMLSKTERGEQARDYFIKVEHALKNVAQGLPQATPNQLISMLAQANVELEQQLTAVKSEVRQMTGKIDTAMQVFSAPSKDNWKGDMTERINAIVIANGLSHSGFRGQLYSELEENGVNLNSRVSRLRSRMKKQGATYREQQAITKLEVVSRDRQLRPIFESIVRKYQAVYGMREREA